MPRVNPEVLRWARETAGLSPDAAAHKIGLKAAKGKTAEERMAELERGAVEPSTPQLRKMAKHYRRPLISFYLSKPPVRGDRGEDFRSLPDNAHRKNDPLVEVLLRDIKARQEMVRELLADDPDQDELAFVGSVQARAGVDTVARSISSTLGFDLALFRGQPNSDAAFAYLRQLVEAAGIFVVLAGNLGSHHTAIDVEAFRGFALSSPIAPFVVINDQDAKSAWSFTLLHECAHLWLGKSGVSGVRIANDTEKFCSDVASAILLPDVDRCDLSGIRGLERRAQAVADFAYSRRISASMVAYRLHVAGIIRAAEWGDMSGLFKQQWLASREAARERGRNSESGPNYYIVKRHRVGRALLSLVYRSLSEGTLTPTKAGKVLGVKARSVAPLLATQSAPWAA